MNEPKVHMLKSGMIADKIIILLLVLILIIMSLYYVFTKNTNCVQNVVETTKPVDYTITTNKKK